MCVCVCRCVSLFIFCRDLKRDISKKLEKLERRTQKAIVELIRKLLSFLLINIWFSSPIGERLMEDDGDLAAAVAAHNQDEDQDDPD